MRPSLFFLLNQRSLCSAVGRYRSRTDGKHGSVKVVDGLETEPGIAGNAAGEEHPESRIKAVLELLVIGEVLLGFTHTAPEGSEADSPEAACPGRGVSGGPCFDF
jgi:hypothetical protein